MCCCLGQYLKASPSLVRRRDSFNTTNQAGYQLSAKRIHQRLPTYTATASSSSIASRVHRHQFRSNDWDVRSSQWSPTPTPSPHGSSSIASRVHSHQFRSNDWNVRSSQWSPTPTPSPHASPCRAKRRISASRTEVTKMQTAHHRLQQTYWRKHVDEGVRYNYTGQRDANARSP